MAGKDGKKRKKRLLKVLRRCALVLAVLLALGAGFALALPLLLSTDWARGQVETRIAEATGRPASLQALSFGWSEGLRAHGLRIGAGELADPAFLLSLDSLHADFGILAALRRDLRLSLVLSSLRLHMPPPDPHRQPPPGPPAQPLPESLRALFDKLSAGLKPSSTAVDAHVALDLRDIAIRLEPAPGGTALELRGVFLRLDLPGLRSGATLKAGLSAFAEDKALAEAKLEAKVVDLLDAEGRLDPAQARLTAKVAAPGLLLTGEGSLGKTLRLALRAEPRELLAALRPLATAALPEVDGALALDLSLVRSGPERLEAELEIAGRNLRAAHGPLGDKTAGPFSLRLRQHGEMDLAARTVRKTGDLEIMNSSRIRWQTLLDGVTEGRPRLRLELKPLHLDLAELLQAARSLLPPGLHFGSGSLDSEDLQATVLLPQKPDRKPDIDATLTGLALAAKGLRRGDPAGSLRLEGATLRLDKARILLPATDPGRMEATLSASVDGLRLEGKQPVGVRQVRLNRAALLVDELRQDPAALFGLTGKANLELSAQARGVEARGKAQVPELTQALRLAAVLPADRTARAALQELTLDIPTLRVLQPGKRPIEAPLVFRASAPDIRLSQAAASAPLALALRDLKLDLDLGQALRLAATASLEGPGGREVQSQGRLSLDAQKLLDLAPALVPAQAKAAGGLSLDWKLAATLPAPPPQAAGKPAAPEAAKKLSQTIKDLAFVHEAELILRLEALGLDWPLAPKPGEKAEVLRLRGLSTPLPFRLGTREGLRESTLAGSLAFGPLDELPGVGRLAKPLRGLMTVNAAQQGMRSVQFSEILHLDGFELDQNLSLNLDKLDLVLDREADRAAAALELLDASLAFRLVTGLQALPAQAAAKGISGKGRLEAGADLRLTGSRSLSVSALLLSPGLDLRLGQDLAVSGLTSNIRFSRRYSLAQGLRCPGAEDSALPPLSEQVFDQFPAANVRQAPAEALGQLLRTDAAGPAGGGFSLARLSLKSGGLPLDVHDVQLQLDLSGPLPGLRAFRAGLLGGNLLGSVLLRKSAGRYALDADLAFTGIDPGRLFPAKTPRDLGSQAETSGRVSLYAPLTPDPEALLQRLNFRADVTKIGPRTLERMLYALDPEEQNETIVQQRRLMGVGYPRWLRVGAAYGNLNLSGAVDVKGFQLDLPQVDRLAIANLPLRRQLEKPLSAIPQLLKALDAASGSQICRDPADPKGALRFVQPSTPQGVPQ